MTLIPDIPTPETQNQGWKAELQLGFAKRQHQTIIDKRQHFGPLTIQRPFYPEGDICHVYLLHPPGGVVGGDQLRIDIDVHDEAQVLVTTPGATKFNRSSCKLALQKQSLKIGDGCSLEWFPQENIYFNQTQSMLETCIELEKDASFMGWEIHCYGRPAANENFTQGQITSNFALYRDAKPLMIDRLQLNNDDELNSPTCLAGNSCFGTFVATHANPDLLQKAREAIAELPQLKGLKLSYGITLMDDLLVARCLGVQAEHVSLVLKTVWSVIRQDVMQRVAYMPRIWAT